MQNPLPPSLFPTPPVQGFTVAAATDDSLLWQLCIIHALHCTPWAQPSTQPLARCETTGKKQTGNKGTLPLASACSHTTLLHPGIVPLLSGGRRFHCRHIMVEMRSGRHRCAQAWRKTHPLVFLFFSIHDLKAVYFLDLNHLSKRFFVSFNFEHLLSDVLPTSILRCAIH